MTVAEFQKLIEEIYFTKDSRRGVDGTFRWFVEEVGELAAALRGADRAQLKGEFADVFAWLATLASLTGVNLEQAAASKYQAGCPKCRRTPCACAENPGDR